jgi:uncharacterized protein (DUF736 family)
MTGPTVSTGNAPDWSIVTGDGYGVASWVEARRADGAYIIVDTDDGAIMEDGLFAEDGSRVALPADVRDQINDLIDGAS